MENLNPTDVSASTADAEAAKKADAPSKKVKARVLQQCQFGQPNDVVELDASAVKSATLAGLVCADKGSVAYAIATAKTEADSKD